jgi:uncharacterized protein (DUF2336 family)
MSAQTSLIPELEEVVEHGSPERRVKALERLTAFFLDRASGLNEDHVRLFDDVLTRLIDEIDAKARAELSERLAPVRNAPVVVIQRLARNDDIAIASPVLMTSRRLTAADLADIARTKSQAHLLAIAGRSGITEPVTDVLVSRGEPTVVRRLAENHSGRLSDISFLKLIDQSKADAALAKTLGLRPDISSSLLRELLLSSPADLQQRLLASAGPAKQAEIKRVLASIAAESDAERAPRDYAAAQRAIDAMREAGKLNEAALLDFAQRKLHEKTAAALASLCAVPIEVVDRLMSSERADPVLILCKAAGWGWPTAKTVLSARPGGASGQTLDSAFANFERLPPATAQRVMRFWQLRRS